MAPAEDGRSIGSLLGDLGRQVSTLVRKEIELARLEITSGVARAGKAAAVTSAGGALVYAGLLVLLAAAVLGLIETGMAAWLAAFLVGVVVLLIGVGLTSSGMARMRAVELAPKQTAETVRENVEFVKEQMQ
jgi:xanthine/uracil permease